MRRELKDAGEGGWTLTPIHEEKEMHVHPNGEVHYESECDCNWSVDTQDGYRIYNHEQRK